MCNCGKLSSVTEIEVFAYKIRDILKRVRLLGSNPITAKCHCRGPGKITWRIQVGTVACLRSHSEVYFDLFSGCNQSCEAIERAYENKHCCFKFIQLTNHNIRHLN